jgi:ferredoxin
MQALRPRSAAAAWTERALKQPRQLVVDPIACDGHGLCAELFPERITLDDWGFPIVDPTPIPGSLERHARRAVADCPMRALRLGSRARPGQPAGRIRRS